MVKVKNANVGRGENYEEGESSRGGRTRKGKGKKVASEMRLPERNEEGILVRGGQEDDDKSDEEEEEEDRGQDAMNVDEEVSEEEPKEETFRREMKQKKRQEKVEEGQSSGGMSQLMEMMASMQAQMNNRFDALDGKISDIQERLIRLEARGREEDK
ncbi:hypothetical protein M9H77_22775 [Catharanthus roseus]|uniref:Uncharacterized protein n=1 Tax=Catharanthus roseus TaxID=4058 RepID=A0ACC0ATZ2_CATRO|nr:hypothetical protein M9H77_22775 [Catharanthus roseus]